MKIWARHHARALGDALRRWRRQPLANVAAATVIALALLLPIAGAALVDAASRAASTADHDVTVTVFLDPAAGEDAVTQVGQALRAHEGAAAVAFKPRAQALEELKARPAWADLLDELDANPLPDAYFVRLGSRDPAAVRQLREQWSALPSVGRVMADTEWAETLARATRLAERVLGGTALLLGLAVLAVVAQLTRMQVVTRRAQVELSQLLGASAGDVRRPFLWEGWVLGVVAGAVASLAANGILLWLGSEVQALTSLYSFDLKIELVSATQFAAIVALTGLLGLVGSGLAVNAELRRFGHASG